MELMGFSWLSLPSTFQLRKYAECERPVFQHGLSINSLDIKTDRLSQSNITLCGTAELDQNDYGCRRHLLI